MTGSAPVPVPDHPAPPRAAIVRRRSPAIAVTFAFAAGIVLDSVAALPLIAWAGLLVASWLCWLTAWRKRRRWAATWLLIACAAAGGLRQHIAAATRPPNNVARYARDDPQPVHLRGRVITAPVVVPRRESSFPGTIPEYDRTLCEVVCQALVAGESAQPATGLVRLEVTGHLLHVEVGDEIAVWGTLSRPGERWNPGGFDFREYLARQGIDAVVRTDFPDAVRVISPAGRTWGIEQAAAGIRRECGGVLKTYLSPRNAPIAAALLLGDRTDVPEAQRTAFAESGTMHFLALSGLHVGILAALLWGVCRLFRVGETATALVILLCLVGYALINDARPPVIRATIMAGVLLAGRPWRRSAPLGNSLAIAALVLLLWNPQQLFEVGPQLSFLAVAAIAAYVRMRGEFAADGGEPSPLRDERTAWIMNLFTPPLRGLRDAFLVTAAIWLITLPLIAARFHLVSPIGLVVNVLLLPIVAGVLWSGYALLFCGLLFPPLAPVCGWVFDGGLSLFLAIVDRAQRVGLGHWHVPGPDDWWLAGFYPLLLITVFAQPGLRLRRWAARVVLCWCAVGLVVAVFPNGNDRLRCTFLSVGHGCAVLIELPDGGAILYDAGQLHNAERTERIVENAAWARGITRFDAIVISHADVDHFNAVPGIVETFPVGAVYLSPSALDWRQRAVGALCDAVAAANVPLHLIGGDDRLLTSQDVTIRVLGPAGNVDFGDDNANSIVLAITYRDREILLTGDLEGGGREALLATPQRDVDVLMAPHHGSRNANTTDLARWCGPEYVIISGGRRSADRLSDVYSGDTRVLSTWTSGAITVTIDDRGNLNVDEYRPAAEPSVAGETIGDD